MPNEKSPGYVPLSNPAGRQTREHMTFLLNQERAQLNKKLEKIFRHSLDDLPFGSSDLTQTPQYWERLVDACTTVGSRALDVIEKRLRIIGHTLQWDAGVDYRTLAHQMYLATDQARKMKNVYMQRRKCVQAVIKAVEAYETKYPEDPAPSQDLLEPSFQAFQNWMTKSFSIFRQGSKVNPRFHDMYWLEWEQFCEEYYDLKKRDADPDSIFESYYEKYAIELEKSLRKGPYNFRPRASKPNLNDIDLSKDLALNLKLNSGELIMMYEFQNPIQVDIMSLSSEIFFELMNKYQIESLGVLPIQSGNKGIRIELPKPDKPDVLPKIQSTVMEIFAKYTN